ncbi:hypothetical protein [Aquabacterium sp.]|uniref:hypothetical protein n=1 Tax=Aquabacterium sp. TaxID=1872578 RepID=UPI0025BB5887|nr:hypothetical protein [Aquabacterium sp.]
MKFTKIALAVVATAAIAGQAQAATTFLSGASATSINYVKSLQSLCGGTFAVFKETAGVASLGNFFTAKCSQDFNDLAGVDAVAFNVSGGSYTAILNSSVLPTNAGLKFVQTFTATPVLVTDATSPLKDLLVAPGVTATGSIQTEGGFLDIEPAAFDASLLAPYGGVEGLADKIGFANFSQAFGVAVSNSLYTALQAAQGLTGCGANDLTPACQPTVSRAQYASIATSSFNSAKTSINSLFGVPAGKLTLCRRASTSGTQAASNQFFLNNLTGNGPNAGAEVPADAANYGPTNGIAATFEVKEGAGTSNARDCLNAAGYGIGVLSLENVPAATTGYRFVKLNRVEGFDAAKASKDTAIKGEYEFAFQATKFSVSGAGTNAVIEAIDAGLTSISVNGLWGSADSQFGRNGNNANVITKQ